VVLHAASMLGMLMKLAA